MQAGSVLLVICEPLCVHSVLVPESRQQLHRKDLHVHVSGYLKNTLLFTSSSFIPLRTDSLIFLFLFCRNVAFRKKRKKWFVHKLWRIKRGLCHKQDLIQSFVWTLIYNHFVIDSPFIRCQRGNNSLVLASRSIFGTLIFSFQSITIITIKVNLLKSANLCQSPISQRWTILWENSWSYILFQISTKDWAICLLGKGL